MSNATNCGTGRTDLWEQFQEMLEVDHAQPSLPYESQPEHEQFQEKSDQANAQLPQPYPNVDNTQWAKIRKKCISVF